MLMRRFYFLLFIVLSACTLAGTTELPQVPTATTVRVIPSTIVPTVSRQMNEVAQAPTPQTPTADAGACESTAGQPATRHAVIANLNYVQRAMMVQQTVRYINRSNEALSTIILGVEPNQWPGAFKLNGVMAQDQDVGYELTGRRLVVDLPEVLEPGCTAEFKLNFQLNIPQIGQGITAYRGFLGYSERQINLGNWLPVVVPHLNNEWILREAVFVGEQTVFDVADWDVTLNVSAAPDNLAVAGPGNVTHIGDKSWHFEIQNSRDFTLSLSDAFNITSSEIGSGVRVDVYAFDDAVVTLDDGTEVDGAAHALDVAARSLAMYEDLFGPYPYESLVIVEGDFPDGMEFSGLVFVSQDWFERFEGNPASFLTIITVHEVAHQWWYAGVGSDQAMTPWLDEALATYSEYVFIEEYYPELKDWWWSWRVDAYTPQGLVDSNVYQFSTIREYINAVYLLGARMLHEIRNDIGTEAFFEVLRRYYEAGQGRIVSPDVFWSMMSADELTLSMGTRRRYLRQAGPDG